MADEKGIGNQAKDMAKDQIKGTFKEGAKHVLKAALPYIAAGVVIFVLIAWIIDFLDKLKFENMLAWLQGTDSGYMVDSQGVYHIEGHLGDYEYKLIDAVEDEYDETLFYEELEEQQFDSNLFTSGSEENKIIYRLIKNGLDISEYESEEELKCLPLFIRASVSNSSPYLGLTTGELKGKIEIYRQKEGTTDFQQLKFIKKDELQGMVAADRNKAREYFSLTDDGKIIVAVNNSIQEDWAFLGINTEEAKRHPDYGKASTTTPQYQELSLEYQNIIGPYTISFEFLHALLIKTKDPVFCTELANKVKYDGSNPIQVYIYDNTTVETSVVDTTYRGKLKREYKYNCNITYTDADGNVYPEENNWDFYLKSPGLDYYDTENYSYQHKYTKTTTYDNPIIVVQKANSLFYNYERPICATNTPTTTSTTNTNPYEGEQPKDPGNPPLHTSPILAEYTARADATNEYQVTYPARIVSNIWFGWGGVSLGNIYKYFLTEEKEEVITYTQTKTEYTESPASVAFNEGDKSFYKTFTDANYEDARAAIYETDLSLFDMLGLSTKSAYFIDLLKYSMWKESGINYGVKDLELLNLLERVELNSTYQSTASQVLQFNITDAAYFVTDTAVLSSALSGYSELQVPAILSLLIQQQTQYGINAMTVVSAAILQTEGGNDTALVSGTNNLFGILNPDGSIKIYASKEESIKDFYAKLNNEINTTTKTNTISIAEIVCKNSTEDPTVWKKNYDEIVLETFKNQNQVEIPKTLGWGTPTINPNGEDDGFMFTYPSRSGREYKEWAQNKGPWRKPSTIYKRADGSYLSKDWCARTAVSTIVSGYGSTATPEYYGWEYPSVSSQLTSLTGNAVEVTTVGNNSSVVSIQEKQTLINHLGTGDPAILYLRKDLGASSQWTSSQHYIAILDVNDNNEIYVSNPYYGGPRGWTSIDILFSNGLGKIYFIKTK